MSIRVDTSSWISGAIVCGDRGLGVLADDIPSDGDNGGSFLFNDISLPADSSKEICGRITTWPSAGTLYAYEDGSFEFSDAPDGICSFQYQLYVDGAASGTGTVSLQVGASTVTISATAANATFSGAAGSGAAVSIDAVADASIFSGGAVSIPASSGLISATTDAAKFSGMANVAPVAMISAQSAAAVFNGSVVVVGITWPVESDVRLGVIYGPTGAEYTGTMEAGTGVYPTADQIAAAVLAALQATTIPVNNTLINGAQVIGDGSEANPWRGAGVSP